MPESAVIDPERRSPPRLADASNLEDPLLELGADVKRGCLVGRLHDFSDHSSDPLEILADRAGALLMMHFPAHIAKGVALFAIAQDVTL